MPILPNPFDPDETPSEETNRFTLDADAFMAAIEPPLRADELVDVLAVLAGH